MVKMKSVVISTHQKDIKGKITLSGSKSISNRVLLIRALCKDKFEIKNLSDSDDTITLEKLLSDNGDILDAHHAGTTFRFLTAYFSVIEGTRILTGSERMKQRPIKALVDALNKLGANISYLENEGFPPLKISSPASEWKKEITLPADISSQYISALLLIAPTLPNGLTLLLEGEIVSRPYIEMTIAIMGYFGIKIEWVGQSIKIEPQSYKARDYFVEADWSAASYYYVIAGLSDSAAITLCGLQQQSIQGDANICKIGEKFGIKTVYGENEVKLIKSKDTAIPGHFEYNFIKEPDIAQSISVLCAGLGVSGLFSGLQTLSIKETDRIAALQSEHAKMNVFITKMPSRFSSKTGVEYYMQEGISSAINNVIPEIDTYNDHRMAMSFAPLALKFPICINDPMVVSKSYPAFWNDLKTLGFQLTAV